MKKLFFIAGMLTAVQVVNAQHFQIGIKGGVNVSNFSGSSNAADIQANSLVGFHAGGFLNFGIGKSFSIQPEVLVSSQGAKIDQAGNEENFKVTYINIPVMAKLRFSNGFYLEAGPQIGFKASDNIQNSTISEAFKGSDLSIAAGLGFHSRMGLGIGARYTAGISKVGDFSFDENPNVNYKNSVVQVSLFNTIFNRH